MPASEKNRASETAGNVSVTRKIPLRIMWLLELAFLIVLWKFAADKGYFLPIFIVTVLGIFLYQYNRIK
ncbi:hypothetical protein SAMN02745213_00784 [Succinivibrio dextrinosolvens DSM 3072]|uniref:Uncharacterized protein n=1 Tax=Succinivibrio dextrinosolvens DSM 3072 TaxID=1123324 RepID=A0A1T4V547_9GAMM|nr:hypothetical protein [Succinivibrio dextrinosolvens]SKA60006.1 hypothetical protein SAMN02745213_00784 [Succinivibrio dextrinosolvens DSM 3072]